MTEETKPTSNSKRKVIYWILLVVLVGVIFYADQLRYQQLQTALKQQSLQLESQQKTLSILQNKEHLHAQFAQEIRHYLEMANFEMLFYHDIPETTRLLKIAQQHIKNTNDSILLDLQQILDKDIISLQEVPNIDVENIVLRIEKISEAISGLPILSTQSKQVETKDTNPKKHEDTSLSRSIWQRFLAAVMQTLQESIVIHHHTLPLEPLLPPTQQAYLVANIRSQLSQASWAALHGQPKLYEHAITQSINWLRQYYREDLVPVQDILQRLSDLQKINVKPPLPDISAAIKELDELSTREINDNGE